MEYGIYQGCVYVYYSRAAAHIGGMTSPSDIELSQATVPADETWRSQGCSLWLGVTHDL